MSNNVTEEMVPFDTNVNEVSIDYSDSISLRGGNSDLGDNGNTIGAGMQLKEKPEKFLLPYNALTYGLELPTCSKNAMIIFNQENFKNPSHKRVGSGKDVEALTETFEQFKFKVFTCEDYDVKDLLETLKDFWKRNYDAYGCLCVALLTHGRKGDQQLQLQARDWWFQESEFFNCFDIRENKTLAGKPIIIIVQACGGENPTDNVVVELAMRGAEDQPRFMFVPTHSNILLFRSCYSNTASIRSPEGGLFIRSLCQQMKETPGQDFEYICVQVKRKLAEKFDIFQQNQMPVVTSTLTKKLLLKDPGPNADLGYGEDPRRMPPTYFLQYYNYIKKCYRLYTQTKDAASADSEACRIHLDLENNNENSISDMLDFIQGASTYLKGQRKRLPEFDFVYYHYHE